jgi:hypothetical protein
MHFGNLLAELATDIAAGHNGRKMSITARKSDLSTLRAAARQTASVNMAQRTTNTAAQREKLAADIASLGAAVQSTLAAARLDLSAKRQTIAANAHQLRNRLAESRRDGSATVSMFRAEVRRDHADAAKTLTAMLGHFVADVRAETAAVQGTVQSQLRTARAAWGRGTKSDTPPATRASHVASPANAYGPAPKQDAAGAVDTPEISVGRSQRSAKTSGTDDKIRLDTLSSSVIFG